MDTDEHRACKEALFTPTSQEHRLEEAFLAFLEILVAWDQDETGCKLDVAADPINPEIGDTPP